MRKLSTFTTAAVLALGIAGAALAQTTPPAGAEHEGHHPDAPAAAKQPASPPARGAPGAGMAGPGGDMGRMMQQMERRVAFLNAQLDAMRAVSATAAPLYATLSEEQRRTADELMAEHFRSMRMGM